MVPVQVYLFFMKRNHKIALTIVALLLSLVSAAWNERYPEANFPESPAEDSSATSTIQVIRIVDGDTFEVSIGGAREKIRMLGIDTPESVDPRRPVQCFGKEATKKLKELIEGKNIELVADMTNDDRDKYDRLLRYVKRDDGLDVNAEMIKQGYAYAYIKFPFERRAEYLKLQTAARSGGVGLWATTTCSGRR